MNYPPNSTVKPYPQNPTLNNELNRTAEQDKRPPSNMPYIPTMPFRIQAPYSNPIPPTAPSIFRMPDQQIQCSENHQNLGDQMNLIQATLLYYQNGFKQLYEANYYLQMAFEQRSMALQQKTLEYNRIRHMFEEVYSEKIKLTHYYQNLFTQQQTNPVFSPFIPISLPSHSHQNNQNHPQIPIKNYKIQQKTKPSEKQSKTPKTQQRHGSPGKKRLSPEQNQRKRHYSIKEKQGKKINVEKEDQTEEKKIMSNQEESQEEQEVKRPHEEFKYYHRTFETKQAMMEYKNKLRGRQSNTNGKNVKQKTQQRRVRNKNYEYIQLDNAPKALKKLKEEYFTKKQQYFKAKESSKTLGIQDQNHQNTKKNKSKSKAKKNQSNQSQQLESLNQNQMKHKITSDQKKKKQPVKPAKQFLSDAPEESQSQLQKQQIPQYSILKPLLQPDKCQLTNKPEVSFTVQLDQITTVKQPIKKEQKSIESLPSLIVEEQQQYQKISQAPQKIILQKNYASQGNKIDANKEVASQQNDSLKNSGQKDIQPNHQLLNQGSLAVNSDFFMQCDIWKDSINDQPQKNQKIQKTKNIIIPQQQNQKIVLQSPQNLLSQQDNSDSKIDNLDQPQRNQVPQKQIQFIPSDQAVQQKKASDERISSQLEKNLSIFHQFRENQVEEEPIIVYYDHEERQRFEMKDANIKKKKQKVKIPCFKDDAFMVIKNWRDYQRLTGYNIVFQGVFQSEQELKKDFDKIKYDHEVTQIIPKKQKKQRKARGKYKKRQNQKVQKENEGKMNKRKQKKEDQYSEEEQEDMVDNSESELKQENKVDEGASI